MKDGRKRSDWMFNTYLDSAGLGSFQFTIMVAFNFSFEDPKNTQLNCVGVNKPVSTKPHLRRRISDRPISMHIM